MKNLSIWVALTVAVAILGMSPLAFADKGGVIDRSGIYYEGSVLDVDGATGVISLGSRQGVVEGDRFNVIRKGKSIVDPKTKRFIRRKQILVCEMVVKAVNRRYSDVKFIGWSPDVKKGDYIRSHVAPPQNLKAKSIGFREVEISWKYDAQPEIKSYIIYRSKSRKGPFEEIGRNSSSTNVKYIDRHGFSNQIEDGATYYYRVITENNLSNHSPGSKAAMANTYGRPLPPKNIRAKGQIRAAKVTWALRTLEGISGYKVYRRKGNSGSWEMVKDIRSKKESEYFDYGTDGVKIEPKLPDSTTYSYTVSSYSKYGNEGTKGIVATTTTKPAPKPPVGFEAVGWQARNIPLSWKEHTDEDVRGYYIYRALSKEGPFERIGEIAGRKRTSYMVGDPNDIFGTGRLDDFTIYYFKMAAYNWAKSKSNFTNVISATTKAAPLVPEELSATSNRPQQIPLAWRKNPEIDLKEYHIYRSDTEFGDYRKIGTVPPERSYYLEENLLDAQTFYYKIAVVDNFGLKSNLSEAVMARTKSIPKKVSRLRYSRRSGKVYIRWKANREIDIDHYEVFKKNFLIGWRKVSETTGTSFKVEGMKSGDRQDYSVIAVDVDKMESERSDTLTVDIP